MKLRVLLSDITDKGVSTPLKPSNPGPGSAIGSFRILKTTATHKKVVVADFVSVRSTITPITGIENPDEFRPATIYFKFLNGSVIKGDILGTKILAGNKEISTIKFTGIQKETSGTSNTYGKVFDCRTFIKDGYLVYDFGTGLKL